MSEGNFIKLHRSLLTWEWYSDINTTRVFVHMLFKANWKEGKFQGIIIPRGSFVSSIGKLAEETSLTIREVRTAISHLKLTNEVTSKSTNKFTIFTVNNYDWYQSNDKPKDNQATNERQSNDIQTTTIEEYKEYKEEKNNINEQIESFFEEIWKLYFKKKGKNAVTKKAKKKLFGVGYEKVSAAIQKYKEECEKNRIEDQYIMHGSTFFNGRWEEYVVTTMAEETERPTSDYYQRYLSECEDSEN